MSNAGLLVVFPEWSKVVVVSSFSLSYPAAEKLHTTHDRDTKERDMVSVPFNCGINLMKCMTFYIKDFSVCLVSYKNTGRPLTEHPVWFAFLYYT